MYLALVPQRFSETAGDFFAPPYEISPVRSNQHSVSWDTHDLKPFRKNAALTYYIFASLVKDFLGSGPHS